VLCVLQLVEILLLFIFQVLTLEMIHKMLHNFCHKLQYFVYRQLQFFYSAVCLYVWLLCFLYDTIQHLFFA